MKLMFFVLSLILGSAAMAETDYVNVYYCSNYVRGEGHATVIVRRHGYREPSYTAMARYGLSRGNSFSGEVTVNKVTSSGTTAEAYVNSGAGFVIKVLATKVVGDQGQTKWALVEGSFLGERDRAPNAIPRQWLACR